MEYNIKDVKIESISTYNTKKDGSPLVTKNGNPFKKVLLEVDSNCIDDMEFNGRLSMLDFDNVTDDWDEGTEISGKIIHDGDWWNFELPRRNLKQEIEELEKENKELKEKIERLENKPKGKIRNDPDEEIDLENDLPF
jgi:hypothetical protein